MTTHEINLLIERYLDGATTPAEERELALAVQREDRPAEWAIIAEMLGELTLDEAIYDEIMAQRAPKPAKRLTKLWPWAAAACVAITFALSYNIKKEEPQETAKVGPQETTKVEPQELAKVEPPQPVKTQKEHKPVLVARIEQPSHEPQHQQVLTIQPLVRHNKPKPQIEQPLAEEQASPREPLPEIEPQLIAEAQEPTPPSEDFALCMALLAEVEARAIMLQQPSPPLEGIYTAATDALSQEAVTTSPQFILSIVEGGGPRGVDGEWNFLLDELLANIQQQSNRPELSL